MTTGGATVLVVSPDAAVRKLVGTRLEQAGILARYCDELRRVATAIADAPPTVVVIDLDRHDPLRDLAVLQEATPVPVVALLTNHGPADHVDVLEAGADACVAKPFTPREIGAAVTALLRRAASTRSTERLEFDGLIVDLATREVEVRGEIIPMPAREFDLLAFLASSPRQVFTRAQLLENVWSAAEGWVGIATVTEHIRRLRTRIEKDPKAPRWIITVRSVGYRFDPAGETA